MMSLNVIRPTNLLFASTIGNFSILLVFKICSAFSKSFSSVVIKSPEVIIFEIERLISFSKRKSLLVTMPKRFIFSSTIGMPPILFSCITSNASPTVASNPNVIGSKIIPLSDLFTFLTSNACCSIDMFL